MSALNKQNTRSALLFALLYLQACNMPGKNIGDEFSTTRPEDNRFTKTVLSNDLNEPMELAVAPDGKVFFTERSGAFYVYLPKENKTKLLYNFPARAVDKYLNGLIGITLDPDFKTNNYIYFFYSSATGEQYHQNVSRFKINSEGNLDTASEKIIIKIPIDLEVSAHTGGSLAWDKNKNLYISTGDNTVPFESDGYAPIDERIGRMTFDAQRSAANTNDLRGKILRIHPEPDGTYTIPQGNLFPQGTSNTRPEIYVMGCRNPYRIAVDTASSILYWGEVGPDAGQDSRHGPRGYDEINQARTAGNYGWPYFVGNNKAYNDSNFATRQTGALYDVKGATNNSPNNTGEQLLPPPRPAMIWYPYNRSDEFPMLADGGRCAMGGPFYNFNASLKSSEKLPRYYDHSLFIYDWMRNWVFAVHLDKNNNYKNIEPFMQTNGDFRRPVDIEIGPDGVMYMLEYGSVYGIDNTDARLVKITFNGGNRAPAAVITAADTIGATPMKVVFDAGKSYDLDKDKLSYNWTIEGKAFSSSAKAEYNFDKKGVYNVVLKVSDGSMTSTDTLQIVAGNTLPEVKIATHSNRTFFFAEPTSFSYDVIVRDKEDGPIDEKLVKFVMNYIPKFDVSQKIVGHQQISANFSVGAKLIASSDCKACHQLNAKAVGPAFVEVSKKYRNQKNIVGRLANKIITGGGGVWGEHAMNAHPQLSTEEASEIVQYILSLSKSGGEKSLPLHDSVELSQHSAADNHGRYVFTATYTDKGNGVKPLTSSDVLVLQPATWQAEYADSLYDIEIISDTTAALANGSYFVLKNVDLSHISQLTYKIASKLTPVTVEVRQGSPNGALLSTLKYDSDNGFREVHASIVNPGAMNDLYVVCRSPDEEDSHAVTIDWIRFERNPAYTNAETKRFALVADQNAVVGGSNISEEKRGLELLLRSDCTTCHTKSMKLIGPSYSDIAKRYGHDHSSVSRLADKIIKGGHGLWGNVPMTPHKDLTHQDAQLIVKYILTMND